MGYKLCRDIILLPHNCPEREHNKVLSRGKTHCHTFIAIMIFNQKNKKKVSIVWSIICVFIILSMLLMYAPAFFG